MRDPDARKTGIIIVIALVVFLCLALLAASSKAQQQQPQYEALQCARGYCIISQAQLTIILNDATRAYEYAKWCRWIKDR